MTKKRKLPTAFDNLLALMEQADERSWKERSFIPMLQELEWNLSTAWLKGPEGLMNLAQALGMVRGWLLNHGLTIDQFKSQLEKKS